LLGKILEEEQRLKKFPGNSLGPAPEYAVELGYAPCDCPKCRARRGEPVKDGELLEVEEDEGDDFDEDFDEDEDEDELDGAPAATLSQLAEMLKEVFDSLPPEIARTAAQQLKKAMADGENTEAVRRIMGKALANAGLPMPSQSNNKEKAARVPSPEQGRLF
jgi:hypothetical protein